MLKCIRFYNRAYTSISSIQKVILCFKFENNFLRIKCVLEKDNKNTYKTDWNLFLFKESKKADNIFKKKKIRTTKINYKNFEKCWHLLKALLTSSQNIFFFFNVRFNENIYY